jgi:hypothetical protein
VYSYDEIKNNTKPQERELFDKILQFLEGPEATKVFLGYKNLIPEKITASTRT